MYTIKVHNSSAIILILMANNQRLTALHRVCIKDASMEVVSRLIDDA
jgi:hypothetical protein